MLDEAKQKHDALSQAYTALQAAYRSLRMNNSPQLGRQAQTRMAAAPAFVPAPTGTGPLDGLGVDMFALPGLGAYPM
jgi:anti-sigma factor RsiW